MARREGLSPVLKSLVRVVEATLGEVVAEAAGPDVFESVEAVRQAMVRFRRAQDERGRGRHLRHADRVLGELTRKQRAALARAYAVYLELANVCENAYRSHRLRRRAHDAEPTRHRADVVFVLTAHPTESRSPENIRLLRRVQGLLLEALEAGTDPDPERLRHLLHLVWRVGTHPRHKPTVEDEARHLFGLLSNPILASLLELRREGHGVRLRTWVGGDKDGHPGVGPQQTSASLDLSRQRLLEFVRARLLAPVARDAALLSSAPVDRALEEIRGLLDEGLARVRAGDGGRIRALEKAIRGFQRHYRRRLGLSHPDLDRLSFLLDLFPGLVVPLELREERGRFGPRTPIARMLERLGAVARGGEVVWYVRGVVVSMASRPEDLLEAFGLSERVLGGPVLPVIPLFELPDVLRRAAEILEETWADPAFRAAAQRLWEGRVEVMLGYSDTAKRMGVLASRLAIHETMKAIGSWGESAGVQVVFFHGSGGSVGRGGGTVQEQAATWPSGAADVVKQTLQGEMVERSLASPEILRRQVSQIADVQAAPPEHRAAGPLAQELAARSEEVFAEVVGSEAFQTLLREATPYTRLGTLTIGSRPAKRGGSDGGIESLRAIPWVLCWTQTRYLLHAWLGVGAAWRELRETPGAEGRLRRALEDDPFLRAYLRLLGFTLAKTAPRVWREYVARLADGSEGKPRKQLLRRLEREWEDAVDLARRASSDDSLLPDRPWLEESIHVRAPMIHPLNLLQIQTLARERMAHADELLFRETVTGIAAGMLTTG